MAVRKKTTSKKKSATAAKPARKKTATRKPRAKPKSAPAAAIDPIGGAIESAAELLRAGLAALHGKPKKAVTHGRRSTDRRA